MIDKVENCCGCRSCYNICLHSAIQMKPDNEGFFYPIIDKNKCVNCGQCKKSCPVINQPKNNTLNKAFACYSVDFDKRMRSCSGAVFALLSEKVLNSDGVIYGAAFNNDCQVHHICVSDSEGLEKLKGSKYIQSDIGFTYLNAQRSLKSGKLVLFSGTPCQIAGLKQYLKKDYENLFCIDLICHGVPSPMIWEKYLNEISPEHTIVNMSFRNKENGIKNKTLDYTLDNGDVIKEKYEESDYIKGFIQNMYLRPSCYSCKFKGFDRCSDITIGDFWGLKNYYPNFGDDYGVSAVITHSNKGLEFFESLKDDLCLIEVEPNQVATYNESLLEPAKMNPRRNELFERMSTESIHSIVTSMYDNSFWDQCISTNETHQFSIKKTLKRLFNIIK